MALFQSGFDYFDDDISTVRKSYNTIVHFGSVFSSPFITPIGAFIVDFTLVRAPDEYMKAENSINNILNSIYNYNHTADFAKFRGDNR